MISLLEKKKHTHSVLVFNLKDMKKKKGSADLICLL